MPSNNTGRPIKPHRSGQGAPARPITELPAKICKHGIKHGPCSKCQENSDERFTEREEMPETSRK